MIHLMHVSQGMPLHCYFMLHPCNSTLFKLLCSNDFLRFSFSYFQFVCVIRLTFKRVIKKKSTEEFSCVPYIIALSNCLLYTWYGLPIVSVKWENFPVVTINGLGVLLEISFIIIYIRFASVWNKARPFYFIYSSNCTLHDLL